MGTRCLPTQYTLVPVRGQNLNRLNLFGVIHHPKICFFQYVGAMWPAGDPPNGRKMPGRGNEFWRGRDAIIDDGGLDDDHAPADDSDWSDEGAQPLPLVSRHAESD